MLAKKRTEFLSYLHRKTIFNKPLLLVRYLKDAFKWEYKVFVNDQKGIIYFPIYKAGSSSLSQAFLNNNFYQIKYSNITNYQFNIYFKFTFIRNTLDRLYSCWKDKIRYPANWTVISKHKDLYEDMSYKEFLKVINSMSYYEKDKHFINQNYFIIDDYGYILVDEIYNFKNLETKYYEILNKFDLNYVELPHKRKTND